MGDGEVDLMEVARFLELKADNMTKLKRKTTRHGRLKRRSICQPRRSTVMAPANAGLLRQRSMEPDGTGLSKYKNNRASLVGFRRHSEARLSDFSDFGEERATRVIVEQCFSMADSDFNGKITRAELRD